MDEKNQGCPICNAPVKYQVRYPRRICEECCSRAEDEQGRKLSFGNTSLGGGFEAFNIETGEVSADHICFIDGVECWADEAHFGGIVIRPHDGKPHDGEPYGNKKFNRDQI